MIRRLIEMYDNGCITGYQLMMDCFQLLDPANPDLVLSELPEEILEEILAYARRYDPRRPHSATFIPPAEDQVKTAERWICAYHAMRSKPVNQ
jgi:hypothetical protein